MFRDYMSDQHRNFFSQLPFVIAAAVDSERQPWVGVLAGPAGFITAPTPRRLEITAHSATDEQFQGLLQIGHPLGLLGIQQHTRRRNRLNGIVAEVGSGRVAITVSQSFGNCPKYIQAREVSFTAAMLRTSEDHWMEGLDSRARAMVVSADTFYIATAHPDALSNSDPAKGVDVSHRGGRPGFIRLLEDGSLLIPDYAGNGFFNSLGNLQLNPLAGLLFTDFTTGDLLHVCAVAEIIWEGAELSGMPGAERLLRLHPRKTLYREGVLPLHWGPATLSPYLPGEKMD
ncbi:MAG: pyridoxamine 5'-phosphate oxidase family protein [Sulfuritalea sp.]|nr:pyridoxamine 5'-phosphate oxidase family protein [Sulfuritalea sp.]